MASLPPRSAAARRVAACVALLGLVACAQRKPPRQIPLRSPASALEAGPESAAGPDSSAGPAPAVTVEVFAPETISTARDAERSPTFTPDGRTVFFSRSNGFHEKTRSSILVSTLGPDGWSRPTLASFSRDGDAEPCLSADGRELVFSSSRPVPGRPSPDDDLWIVRRTVSNGPGGWGEPEHLGDVVNSTASESGPSLTRDGTLYFRSARPGGLGQGDLWRARRVHGVYQAPENLGPAINSPTGEWNVLVAPDESWLVFEASGRETNLSVYGDLYVSDRAADGTWSPARPLAALNSHRSDLAPRLSADGRTFYFSSNRGDEVEDLQIYAVELRSALP